MDTTRIVVDVEQEDEDEKDFYPHFKKNKLGMIVPVNENNSINHFQNRRKNPTFDYNFEQE